MDKSTISKYGSIVAIVVVIAIVMAFATPFTNFIKDSVVNILNSFNLSAGITEEEEGDENVSREPGLYQTGTNTRLYTWDELLSEGIITCGNEGNKSIISSDSTRLAGDLVIGYNVDHISNNAFECPYLTAVVIPDNVTSITDCAFNCDALKSVTIGKGIDYLCLDSFYAPIETLTLSNSITRIDYGAFCCGQIHTDIYYEGTMTEWNNVSLEDGWISCSSYTVHCSDGDIAKS